MNRTHFLSDYKTLKPMGQNPTRPLHKTTTLGKEMKCPLLWNQDITHHIKPRLKLRTLFSPGGQVERWGRHLMWAQTFIYYLLLQSKDIGNEDDYPVTGKNRWTRQTWLNCSLTATCASYNTLQPNKHFLIYFGQ